MVMDVLMEDVRDGSLMELLYTDDLLCGGSLNEVLEKHWKWKNAVEGNVADVARLCGVVGMIRMMCVG